MIRFGVALIVILLTGCAAKEPMTAEQEQAKRERVRAAIASGAIKIPTNQQIQPLQVPQYQQAPAPINCTSRQIGGQLHTRCQ